MPVPDPVTVPQGDPVSAPNNPLPVLIPVPSPSPVAPKAPVRNPFPKPSALPAWLRIFNFRMFPIIFIHPTILDHMEQNDRIMRGEPITA